MKCERATDQEKVRDSSTLGLGDNALCIPQSPESDTGMG